ncbi:hypothetical protein [Longimicrobium sp.]|uniref:hypothetical protein n=1 Tax=Longimicrobium sp. TaxID=2029185 RepID=UPI003B3A4DF8
MSCPRFVRILPLLVALAACADAPTVTPPPEPAPPAPPRVLGVYELTVTGLGTSEMRGSMAPARLAGTPSYALTPRNTGLALEFVSSSSFTEGDRGQGGQRYINATYRVRNSTGAAVSNLTFIPSITATTIAGTPFSQLTLFNGTAAARTLASQMVPTGAVTLGGGVTMRTTEVDVLQVFQESEVAAVPLPAGVTGLMPYGFVTRGAAGGASRTLPNAPTPDDFGGLVTFAFRYPLTASGNQDPFTVSFQVLAVEDRETRLTESIEDGQDTSAVRRIRERAAALGATAVTVLAGSAATAPEVVDYPGQRQICGVRTAGTAAAPTAYITSPAAYTRLNLLRQGETASACGAYFRGGTPQAPLPGVGHTLTLVAQDRYGNLRTVADSVRLEWVSGPSALLGARTALVDGQAAVQVTYGTYGASVLRAAGRRIRAEHQLEVGVTTVAANAGTPTWFTAIAGTSVPTASRPSVRVRDPGGNPVSGRAVTFSVTRGGGTVTSAVVNTNADGVATVGNWLLGATADVNTVVATVSGSGIVGNPVTFSASGCTGTGTGYYITVCFATPMSSSLRTLFGYAASRWQGLITSELTNVPVNQAPGYCSAGMPAINLTIDDLLIYASVKNIDGPGGIVGRAGPCVVRGIGNLPLLGEMEIDSADVAMIEAGSYGGVILHEMGHVIGIGTVWSYFGLVSDASGSFTTLDTYFNGANGIAGFDNVGGGSYTGGRKVPVENTGPEGTRNAHWRESVLGSELMTGYLNPGSNPLSQVTVRSLIDLGYTVNPGFSDDFFLTLTLNSGDPAPQAGLRLMDDTRTGPIYRADPQGRTTRLR